MINDIINVIGWVGTIETIVLVIGICYGFYLWLTGIWPALSRLGNGLAKRKIAIFAKGDTLQSLHTLLVDSGLFKNKNVFGITTQGDFGKAECASVYLVHWSDWSDSIERIVDMKPDKCALIVYAPRERGPIPEDKMILLDGKRHTAVSNFRGRLLNDIVASMITTSYEQ